MSPEAETIAQRRVDITGVTGVNHDAKRLKSPGESDAQHSVGLLGLPVGGIVVVWPLFEFWIFEIETAGPVAGYVDDACARPMSEMIGKSINHPEVAKHIGRELHFDTFGRLHTMMRRDGCIIDQHVNWALPTLRQRQN